VRRLVAACEIVLWPGNGSLLPFSGETNARLQADRGNPGSKLPVWGQHQAVESGDQSPHSKRAMGAMRQKL
jgi:hypothetical protein